MVQLWGVWSDQFRLDTSYNFCGDPQRGNQILIRNLPGRPIILGHWELLYGSRLWPFRKFEFLQLPGQDEFGDQRIEPQDTLTLTFADEDHFDWGHKTPGGRSILYPTAFCWSTSIYPSQNLSVGTNGLRCLSAWLAAERASRHPVTDVLPPATSRVAIGYV